MRERIANCFFSLAYTRFRVIFQTECDERQQFRTNAREPIASAPALLRTPLSINHLHECLHKIETYPKSQSVLFCFFFIFFVRSAANAEALGAAIRWFSTHNSFNCSMSLIFSGIFVHIPLWKWMMNLLTLVYTLHTKHHDAHDVGKCVNRYRVSRECVFCALCLHLWLCFSTFYCVVVCCFEFSLDDVPSTPRFHYCVCLYQTHSRTESREAIVCW